MAAWEPYDILSAATADTTCVLSLVAQGELVEEGFNQVIHFGDDGSEERISLSPSPAIYVRFPFNGLSAADSGLLADLYYNSSAANGQEKSFKWVSDDGHTYVVRFDGDLPRTRIDSQVHRIDSVRLRVLGYAT